MKRTPWLGNGDGHVYEHVMTPPEARTWTWRDCPSFVLVTHPENAPVYAVRPVGNRKVKNPTGLRREQDGETLVARQPKRQGRPPKVKRESVAERWDRILEANAPMVQRDRGE